MQLCALQKCFHHICLPGLMYETKGGKGLMPRTLPEHKLRICIL